MARILLAAMNAKYIHSNLGVYSLKAYAEKKMESECFSQSGEAEGVPRVTKESLEILIGEYTINQQTEQILRDIYEKQPDMVGFSCYIWNISYVKELIHDLHKVLPDTEIWLGGPEVSYDAVRVLEEEPEVRGVMCGEGEEIFSQVAFAYAVTTQNAPDLNVEVSAKGRFEDDVEVSAKERLENTVSAQNVLEREAAFMQISGIVYRKQDGTIQIQPTAGCLDMSKIPFSYHNLEEFENRIIYYESSRGCPFSCSYCLSSIDKRVRFRDLSLVLSELDFFLEKKVPQVKFVDRTFNCQKKHAMAIWKHILEHDNGITNFHFEISADLLGEEELALLSKMRAGLVQLEIGVQSTNPDTIKEIHRKMDLEVLKRVVKQINGFGNIHQHLDLIAGLPYEDITRFAQSFNDVYAMEPEQLQLGFLKVLKGSAMMEKREEYGLLYQNSPPYEVLSTRWISYSDLLRLKGIEDMVEVYYNSRQFEGSMKRLLSEFVTPFAMYDALALFYKTKGLTGINHSRLARYEILYQFICEYTKDEEIRSSFRDQLMIDLYLRENVKSRPSFASDISGARNTDQKIKIRDFFIREANQPKYLKGYEGYDSKQIAKMAHAEPLENGTIMLFDYRNRDALTYNASCWDITEDVLCSINIEHRI